MKFVQLLVWSILYSTSSFTSSCSRIGFEFYGDNQVVPNPDLDPDQDPNTDECPQDYKKHIPGVCGCGISNDDMDGDGSADCIDTCPNDQNKTEPAMFGCGVSDVDSDSDGTLDCHETDTDDDGDGWADSDETACGSDPLQMASVPADSDRDGTPDCLDGCPDDPDKTEPGECNCGVPEGSCTGPGGVVECWVLNNIGQSSPPAGVLTHITAGTDHTCGLR